MERNCEEEIKFIRQKLDEVKVGEEEEEEEQEEEKKERTMRNNR